MTDQEKVIKGLECCAVGCRSGCPYSDIDDCESVLCADALALLKAQERELRCRTPRKVEHEATIKRCCTCPSCGNVLDQFERFGVGKVRIMNKYCHFCGQALDWSDEERSVVRF